MMNIKTKLITFSAALLLTLALPAHAVYNWTYTGNGSVCSGNCASKTNNNGGAGPAVTATATAWATRTDSKNSKIKKATLKAWTGLAVNSKDESTGQPEHATDNNGKKESILFSFGQSIALTQITMGWRKTNGDADFSLLYYDGIGTFDPLTDLLNNKYTDLFSSGWKLAGNYFGNNVKTTDVNTQNGTSKYWLVAAVNGAFGTKSKNDSKFDYFKVHKLQGKVIPPSTNVPEPSTLPLLAISLLGLAFASRRRKQT